MTRTRWTDAERAAVRLACPLCQVGPLAWCRTLYTRRPGAYATALHRERLEAATARSTLFDLDQTGEPDAVVPGR